MYLYTPDPPAFHCAALVGVEESCQALLEATGGVHGNDVDARGRGAIHLAVISGRVECVELLLRHGLAVDQLDAEQRT